MQTEISLLFCFWLRGRGRAVGGGRWPPREGVGIVCPRTELGEGGEKRGGGMGGGGVLSYLEALKQSVKRKISVLIDNRTVEQVANDAFTFHFKDKGSLAFQNYYRETVDNREWFLNTPNFFRVFKQKYSLQGIDNAYLDDLENKKKTILSLIDHNELADLYFGYFANAQLNMAIELYERS